MIYGEVSNDKTDIPSGQQNTLNTSMEKSEYWQAWGIGRGWGLGLRR